MKEETLLEQMTRVRPEVLNENALKLFNKIMEVIDERDELQTRIDKAIQLMYDKATFNLDDKYGKVFLELLETLDGDVDDE